MLNQCDVVIITLSPMDYAGGFKTIYSVVRGDLDSFVRLRPFTVVI